MAIGAGAGAAARYTAGIARDGAGAGTEEAYSVVLVSWLMLLMKIEIDMAH